MEELTLNLRWDNLDCDEYITDHIKHGRIVRNNGTYLKEDSKEYQYFEPQYDLILYRFSSGKSAKDRYKEYKVQYGWLYRRISHLGWYSPVGPYPRTKLVRGDSVLVGEVNSSGLRDPLWDANIEGMSEFELMPVSSNIYAFSTPEHYDPQRFLDEVMEYYWDLKYEETRKYEDRIDAIDVCLNYAKDKKASLREVVCE